MSTPTPELGLNKPAAGEPGWGVTLTNPNWDKLDKATLGLARDVVLQDVVNTTLESLLFSATISGGKLSTARAALLLAIIDYLNNTAAAATLQIKVKYGGTPIFTSDAQSLAQGTTRRGLSLDVMLSAANSANAQYAKTVLITGPLDSAVGLAQGAASLPRVAVHNGLTVVSGSDQLLEVWATHGTADALISVRALAVHAFEVY